MGKNEHINPIIKKILLKEDIESEKDGDSKKLNENMDGTFEEGCIDLLLQLKDYTYDDTIAKNTNLKMSIIRRWLNELQNYKLVEYIRVKDKKTGWYTYKWKIKEDAMLDHVKKILNNKIKKYEEDIDILKTHIFACSCKKYSFEEALELNFRCPKDNEEIKPVDNSKEIKEKELEIKKLENMLNEVSKLKTIYQN